MQAPVSLRIPKELRDRFDRVCEAGAVNKSKLIRQWIEEFTAEKEKELGFVTVKANQYSLEDAITAVIHRAEGWDGYGGECQLYSRFGENGVVSEYFFVDSEGRNRWVEGPRTVGVYTQKWFRWYENEDLGEWLAGELEERPELKEQFLAYLRGEGLEEDPIRHWSEFESFDDEKWEEFMGEWREIFLSHYIHDMTSEVIDRLKEDGWDVSDAYPTAKIED